MVKRIDLHIKLITRGTMPMGNMNLMIFHIAWWGRKILSFLDYFQDPLPFLFVFFFQESSINASSIL